MYLSAAKIIVAAEEVFERETEKFLFAKYNIPANCDFDGFLIQLSVTLHMVGFGKPNSIFLFFVKLTVASMNTAAIVMKRAPFMSEAI